MTADDFWRRTRDGVELFVRLTPKSSRDAVEAVEQQADGRSHLKARVRAVPEDGKANKALITLISKTLRVPASSVAIVAGQTARLKMMRISGAGKDIEERLHRLGGRDREG